MEAAAACQTIVVGGEADLRMESEAAAADQPNADRETSRNNVRAGKLVGWDQREDPDAWLLKEQHDRATYGMVGGHGTQRESQGAGSGLGEPHNLLGPSERGPQRAKVARTTMSRARASLDVMFQARDIRTNLGDPGVRPLTGRGSRTSTWPRRPGMRTMTKVTTRAQSRLLSGDQHRGQQQDQDKGCGTFDRGCETWDSGCWRQGQRRSIPREAGKEKEGERGQEEE